MCLSTAWRVQSSTRESGIATEIDLHIGSRKEQRGTALQRVSRRAFCQATGWNLLLDDQTELSRLERLLVHTD